MLATTKDMLTNNIFTSNCNFIHSVQQRGRADNASIRCHLARENTQDLVSHAPSRTLRNKRDVRLKVITSSRTKIKERPQKKIHSPISPKTLRSITLYIYLEDKKDSAPVFEPSVPCIINEVQLI